MVRSLFIKDLPLLAALTAVYFLAGKLGLKLAFVHASATAVWPCTGIALAAFLLLGYRMWPAILAGAFLVNLTTAGSAVTSVGIAIGNTLEGVAGGFPCCPFSRGRRGLSGGAGVVQILFFSRNGCTPTQATPAVDTTAFLGVPGKR